MPFTDDLSLQVKDMVQTAFGHADADYMYTLVQDAVSGKSKLRQRREKGQPCELSDLGVLSPF